MSETDIVKRVQVAVSRLGGRVFRNNVGVLRDSRGRYVTYGLCPGSSDLIGWMPDGRFLAIEVKTLSKRSKTTTLQDSFLSAVRQSGGVAFVARSEEDVILNLRGELWKQN